MTSPLVAGEGGFLPEVILLTLREMDPFVRFRIGGLVVSRSVKYLGTVLLVEVCSKRSSFRAVVLSRFDGGS